MTKEWTKGKSKRAIEDEMYRLVGILQTQGDIDVLIDMIPLANRKGFIDGWHENDETED